MRILKFLAEVVDFSFSILMEGDSGLVTLFENLEVSFLYLTGLQNKNFLIYYLKTLNLSQLIAYLFIFS